jgi:glycosyltransferase involved in cell wall biosynthesis
MKNRIIFIHLLNDFTGSTNVLSTVIDCLESNFNITIITSRSDGFLSKFLLTNHKHYFNFYKWHRFKIVTFLLFFITQIQLFLWVIFKSNKNDLIYINTILPFGASLASFLLGRKFLYHVHENMRSKKFIYHIPRFIFSRVNKNSILVSNYLVQNSLNLNAYNVIYNCLDYRFLNVNKFNSFEERDTVLMVSSFKHYKGVYNFVKLAENNLNIKFNLILNICDNELSIFLSNNKIPENLIVEAVKTDLVLSYSRARILLVLSDPKYWIETFGMTIIEGFSCGTPSIAPNVGGPKELIKNGVNGYLVDDITNIIHLSKVIHQLYFDNSLWTLFSKNALYDSKNYNRLNFCNRINGFIDHI